MSDTPLWRRYLRITRRDAAADVDDELAFHVAMRIERNVALGMDPETARREAFHRFGDLDAIRGTLVAHDQRREQAEGRRELIADALQDLRFGLRSLRRAPGFAAAAILTLAIGIGANAAIFSVVEGIVLRPLPYERPHELVTLGTGSGGEYLALRERLRAIPQLALYSTQTHPLDDGATVSRLEGAAVTPNLFPLLGASAALGRTFTEEEGIFGNAAVLLLSHGLWQRQFGGSPDAIGGTVRIEGMPHTIVGVMGAEFRFPSGATEYWQPYAFNPANVPYTWAVGGKYIVGRLAPGATLELARDEVRTTWPSLRSLNPIWDPGPAYRRDASVQPLAAEMVGTTGGVVWLLFGCVVLVLLIGCVNVANLLLARGTARARELAVRAALGGGRGRLVRQLLTESLLLAGIGAALGLTLATVVVRWLAIALPPSIPRAHEIALNGTVVAFTVAVSLGAALLFGIVPALRATRFAAGSAVRGGTRTTAGISHHRLSGLLVTGEMTLAVLLVIGATLLVRSFQELRAVEPGFEPARVIAARLTPPGAEYQDAARATALFAGVLERVGVLPGVLSVAAVDRLPIAQPVYGMAVRVEGQFEDATRTLPEVPNVQQVTPDYFTTMGIALRRGRGFTDADREGQPPVAIVSETVARRFWPGEDVVGRRIGYPWNSPWLSIIGVVSDSRQDSLTDTLTATIYVPWQQRTRMSTSEMWVVARATTDPGSLAEAIRRVVREADRSVAVSDVRTMDAVIADSLTRARFTTLLVGALALTALVLGALGVYGVMAYLVSQRTQEIGVRIALGAPPRQVVRLVLSRALGLAAAGGVVGIVAAIAATRRLASFLYGISATDPLTFALVPLLFLVVAAAASYAPARRATRVDPVRALRAD
jgi:predicted permease